MPYSHLAQRSPNASKLRSFLIGLGQMFLMSINVRNMAEGHLVYLTIFTVVNTMVWVWIVRTAIHSTKQEIWAYAAGSAIGANCGVLIHHFFIAPHAFTNLAAFFK
jgi:hypothetical protein